MHHKKIEGILTSDNSQVNAAREIGKLLKKNREERKKTKNFLTNERNININKDN